MKINILEFAGGARNARGVTVIIDVFRAFSVGCYAFDCGARMLIATASVSEALRLHKTYKNSVLIGERDERKIDGFDFGNSPTEIMTADIKEKTVIHTTTAGTNGLVNANSSPVVLTGSLVNSAAVTRYIRQLNPDEVSLVAMGYRGELSADEDILCAEIIADRLKGGNTNFTGRISALKETSGKRFFRAENLSFSPPSDFFLCTMTDRFDFVLRAVRRHDGNMDLIRCDI